MTKSLRTFVHKYGAQNSMHMGIIQYLHPYFSDGSIQTSIYGYPTSECICVTAGEDSHGSGKLPVSLYTRLLQGYCPALVVSMPNCQCSSYIIFM